MVEPSELSYSVGMSNTTYVAIREARGIIQDAQRIVVLTGAGMSAESGVPTFRDAQTGLWEKYSPEELATPEAMYNRPDLVWSWMLHQARVMRSVEPHDGHKVLGRWQRELVSNGGALDIVTQNIDDLHERGGSDVLAHLHGTTFTFRCFDCDAPSDYELDDPTDEQLQATPALDQLMLEDPPACPACSYGFIRPDIVMFGELLPQQAMDNALDAVRAADVAIVVGTSNIVQPAATLPLAASAAGAQVIEINPNQTPLSQDADLYISGTARNILPELHP
ncbi:NAD-dependent deacetylase [Enteractinococcus coprophilus]|uniref:protein acetyllysine N-acetyltransferase n=2 Tax=Enteractinococcus coprophilus TaxID=1027633 RepID=A0A543AF34_9MICC|nr:NAD-dependent deacetylase [Enteractinococcus coprophilus]